jgi:uncharacterized protein DUF4785/uncharacterized protein DUF4784
MKKFKLMSSLSVAALLFSTHLSAAQLNHVTKIPSPPINADLVNLDLPDYDIEQQAVHFSQKVSPTSQLSFQAQGFNSVSDEYWLEATGQQLNSGIALAISNPGALIRLSGKRVNGKFSNTDLAIDPSNVELFKNKKSLPQAFKQTVSQQQFATANIFPNSSAMRLDKSIGKGDFTLRVKQKLNATQRYMVNVKEKNAEHKLHLSIAKQSYIAGESVNFNSFISNKSGKVALVKNKAFIKMPSGEKQAVNFTQKNGKSQVKIPTSLTATKRGELYELSIESQAFDQGTKIRRNAKVAFAVAQPTARIQGELSVNATAANVNLNVASEGRYEISALVYGTAKNGIKTAIMLSRSAYFLAPGEHNVQLKFDQKILKASGLQAPYSVEQLRLMDQSRMALLQQL